MALLESAIGGIAVSVLDTAFKAGGAVAKQIKGAYDETQATQKALTAVHNYVQRYEKRHCQVKVMPGLMKEPLPLEDIYTAVKLLNDDGIGAFSGVDALEATYRAKEGRGVGQDEGERPDGIPVANAEPYLMVLGGPGIGKSTILLQAAAAFARNGLKTIYVSGEEASAQVRMRAQRLGLADAPVKLAAETNLRDILTTLDAEKPDLAIIDSIQTMWADNVDSAPGSVSQVRSSAHELTTFAKRNGLAVIMVGHVTKEGGIAGPRVVEHMVDTVLYFEGERGHQFRILRSVKNRFGPADEIGVFEMTGKGLAEVKNPSALFLSERGTPAPGSVVFAGIEGTRPMLCEIQALRSEEHTSELQSRPHISYAVFCLKKKKYTLISLQ